MNLLMKGGGGGGGTCPECPPPGSAAGCDAGTNCTKCCPCQPRTRGRPRKSDESETPYRINPEREARVHSADVSVGMAVEDCSEPLHVAHTPIAMRHRKHTSLRYWSAWAARIMIVAYEDSCMSMLGSKCYTRPMTRSTLLVCIG